MPKSKSKTQAASKATTALESAFPIEQISELAEQESWRKEVNRPIYHIHKWWATRLGSVFRALAIGALSPPGVDIWAEFYKTHDLKGKVVLDPFMGSGTTLGESLKLGASAVGCDINPVSTFAVTQAFTRVSPDKLRDSYSKVERNVASKIRHYYETRDRVTDEKIKVLYFFWCKVVTTPDGEQIPLLSRWIFAQDAYPKKKPKAQLVCPGCWAVSECRYDDSQFVCPQCDHSFDPQAGPASGQDVRGRSGKTFRIKDLVGATSSPPAHKLYALLALRSSGEKCYYAPTLSDHALYTEAAQQLLAEELPLPDLKVRPGHNTNQALGYNYSEWRSFFNDRQLLCLGLLLKSILELSDDAAREQLICLFSSTLEFNNMFCSYKGEGTGAVRHMFSNHILKPERSPLENSIWGDSKSSGTFSTLYSSRLLRAKKYLEEPFELVIERDLLGRKTGTTKVVASRALNPIHVQTWEQLAASPGSLLILNGNSASLPLPNNSVDAVLTDPPYFDFVHYSELSDFFFAWLTKALHKKYPWLCGADSSHPGEVQDRDPRFFAKQLGNVFRECGRVLKDDGVLAFSFHHSRPEGWAAIYEAVTAGGFTVVNAHPVHAELKGANPKNSAKNPITLDAILVCRKLRAGQSKVGISISEIAASAHLIQTQLIKSGLTLTDGDLFVIGAAETLIAAAGRPLTYDEMCEQLSAMKNALQSHENEPAPI
jgi:putative DNA methylase